MTDFHMHTTFCDGNNTPEEIVLAAIEKGFSTIGFSGHAYIDSETSFCIQEEAAYLAEINRLKAAYEDQICILLGTEEDSRHLVNRRNYDYIIGSSHYSFRNGTYYPLDFYPELVTDCLKDWDNDPLALAEDYYRSFCQYIHSRKPDIIGHFDLITKFDETEQCFFSQIPQYHKIAAHYMKEALKSQCLVEVNTGAIFRGYRTTPYPSLDLLRVIKENDGKVILSSDSHCADALGYAFSEAIALLKDIGFRERYTLTPNGPKKISL